MSQRKQFSVKRKLEIVELALNGKSIRSIASEIGCNESNIRRWIKQKRSLEEMTGEQTVRVKFRKRLLGGGRHAKFSKLEDELHEYVLENNKLGITVKDKYIKAHALHLKDEYIRTLNEMIESDCYDDENNNDLKRLLEELNSFTASSSWCFNFKKRYNLVLRRQTTTRALPDDYDVVSRDFINQCQELIKRHNIKSENILNMDQVPRYFEYEPNHTIATKGSKNIFLKKASSSHKRFTYTPVINGAGKFICHHLLFSKLKNKPTVASGCHVDVNQTGMWNETILRTFMKEVILSRPQTSLLKQPVLFLLDSYPVHVKFVKENGQLYAERYKIFLKLVPPNMTSLLQPLDVAVNKSFQTFYDDSYNQYVKSAIQHKATTAKGNIKIPSYLEASTWVLEWSRTKSNESIAKAFTVCGLNCDFNINTDLHKLHDPLRDCFLLKKEIWENKYGQIISDGVTFFDTNFDEWIMVKSVWLAVYTCCEITESFTDWYNEVKLQVLGYIETTNLKDFFDESEKLLFDEQIITESRVDLMSLSYVLQIQIQLIILDETLVQMESVSFGQNDTKQISILKFSDVLAYKQQ